MTVSLGDSARRTLSLPARSRRPGQSESGPRPWPRLPNRSGRVLRQVQVPRRCRTGVTSHGNGTSNSPTRARPGHGWIYYTMILPPRRLVGCGHLHFCSAQVRNRLIPRGLAISSLNDPLQFQDPCRPNIAVSFPLSFSEMIENSSILGFVRLEICIAQKCRRKHFVFKWWAS